MDYFLTTYSKDFKWPVVINKRIDDKTEIEEASSLAKKKYIDMIDMSTKSKLSSKSEIVPAQVGAPPQGPGSKFDQPSTYLRKLYTKYPYLYEIMKITPPEELAKKVYSEKYKTTYQEDFGSKGFMEFKGTVESLARSVQKDETISEVCIDHVKDMKKQYEKKCMCDHTDQKCTCAQDSRPVVKIAWKPAPISKMIRMPRDKEPKKKESEKKEQEKAAERVPQYKPYKSEYKDTISKIGAIIIKKKLLYCEEPTYETKTET